MLTPVIDPRPGVVQIDKPVLIQARVAEFAIEAFDEGVLHRLARSDEVQRDTASLCPQEHRLAGQSRGVVCCFASKTDPGFGVNP